MKPVLKVTKRFTEPMKTVSAYGLTFQVPVWANWMAAEHYSLKVFERKPRPVFPYHANYWDTKSRSKEIAEVDLNVEWFTTLIKLS